MLLALPFQAVASAAMLTCAHATIQPAAHAMTAMAHDAAGPDGHCHAAADQAADRHPAAIDHHNADGRCSACADCCLGAALAPAPAPFATPSAALGVLIGALARHPARVDLALPERPPRFPLV